MGESHKEAIEIYHEMIKGIEKAGSAFCQYRACKLDIDTIYDLENINNGVVFARSPLYMNDPFDSMIGFSTEDLYRDFCEMLIETIPDGQPKEIAAFLLGEKGIGETAGLIAFIKEFQAFLRSQRNKMDPSESSLNRFALKNYKSLIKKMNPKLKKKIKSISFFCAIAYYTADIDLSMITEGDLMRLFQFDDTMLETLNKFDEIREKEYIPQFRKFLSKTTISCFSASGWDNQLMWAHYANSYSGICIEYDFSTVDGETGLVFPVEYSQIRPTITLRDMGFFISEGKLVKQDKDRIDTRKILSYMLTKNKCWEYEREWRIINIGEENTPRFIEMSKIKSITLGLNMNSVSKHLLIDICRDKKIVCYQLVPDSEKYELKRELIDLENIEFNMEDEILFIEHISDHITGIFKRAEEVDVNSILDEKTKKVNLVLFFALLSQANDLLFYIYCLKKTINSFMRFADESVTVEQYDELREKIEIIDDIVSHIYFDHDDAERSFVCLFQIGIINTDDYQKAITMIRTNLSLQEKVKAIVWDSRIIPNKK